MDEESFGKGWYLITGPSGRFLGKLVLTEEDDELPKLELAVPRRMTLCPTYQVIAETALMQASDGRIKTNKLMILTAVNNFVESVKATFDLSGAMVIHVADMGKADRAELADLLKDVEASITAMRAQRAGITVAPGKTVADLVGRT